MGEGFRGQGWVEREPEAGEAASPGLPGEQPLALIFTAPGAGFWLIAGRVPLPVIRGRLGHESVTTTVDRYGRLLDHSVDDEVVAAVEWAVSLSGRADR